MPENLFYNTSAPGIIMLINKDKKHKKQILLINASKEFSKGRPKNYLTRENISSIAELYNNWLVEEGLSKIISNDESLRIDSNLSPSRYVAGNDKEEVLPLEEAVVLLNEAEEDRIIVDKELKQILSSSASEAQPVVKQSEVIPTGFKMTELGMLPEEWQVNCFRGLVEEITSGDWGNDVLVENCEPCIVIRGTDFKSANNYSLVDAPIRYIKASSVLKRKLSYGDILVELSGGVRINQRDAYYSLMDLWVPYLPSHYYLAIL